MSVALITGGSAGLGRALVAALAARDWTVITDARGAGRLAELREQVGPRVVTVPGDIADPAHRRTLIDQVEAHGALDLLIHNASTLGPVPLRPLRELSESDLAHTWTVNAGAPAELSRALLPWLKTAGGAVIALSSDAAVEHYPTWGAYAASKAALDHLTLTLGAEEGLDTYAIDPGDLRTEMHQAAFPGEDISDRPLPQTVVPAFLEIIRRRPPSGRYRAAEFAPLEV